MSAPSADPIRDAAAWIRAGGLLAYPTETLWGLGADATSGEALERLRRWKGRSADAPVSILVDGADALAGLGVELGEAGRRLAERFWPGPLTLVLPGDGRLPVARAGVSPPLAAAATGLALGHAKAPR